MTIAFFGDSFTFGHGVEVQDRYTNIFAEKFRTGHIQKVANFSYKNGFQPEHYEYFFRHHPQLRPQHAVVGLYLGNDLGADVAETLFDPGKDQLLLPYRRILKNGQMGNAPFAYRKPLNLLADRSLFTRLLLQLLGQTTFRQYLFKPGFAGPNSPNPVDLETGQADLLSNRAIQSLLRLRSLVEERGGALTILIIPQNYLFRDERPHLHPDLQGSLFQLRHGNNLLIAFKALCLQQQLDCYDPSPLLAPEDYYPRDGHWTTSGHLKAGTALAQYLSARLTRPSLPAVHP